MAVRTKEEILEQLGTKFGEDTSDDTLAIIEDIIDTITELETKVTDTTDWKQKYEDNDKEWREKYKSRFFDGIQQEEDEDEYEEKEVPMKTFDDLFKPKED